MGFSQTWLGRQDQRRIRFPIAGAADLRAEIGSGSTPQNGAGSMATDAIPAISGSIQAPYWLICT